MSANVMPNDVMALVTGADDALIIGGVVVVVIHTICQFVIIIPTLFSDRALFTPYRVVEYVFYSLLYLRRTMCLPRRRVISIFLGAGSVVGVRQVHRFHFGLAKVYPLSSEGRLPYLHSTAI